MIPANPARSRPTHTPGRFGGRVALGIPALAVVLALLGASCTDDSEWSAPSGAPDPLEVGVTVRSSSVAASTSDELAAALLDTMQTYGVPGAAVAVRDPEAGDWTATAGVADIETGEPVAEDLQWPIRSITKSFTVTLLLQLADEGRVDLDDTIDTWVPEVPDGDSITLRQLATMTAGVPEYTNDAFVDAFSEDPTATFSSEQLLDFALEGDPVSGPGEAGIYVNTSTVLLGQVVEELTGLPFDEAVAERVLGPLGLDDTLYPTSPEGWTTSHASGYQPDEEGLVTPPTNFTVFDTAGAMVSTLDDLLVWGRALGGGDLLEQQTQRQRLVGAPLEEGPEYDTYASGIGQLDGWWGHTGEGFGFTALVMHHRGTGATVVIAMNLSDVGDHPPTKLFREVAGILSEPS